MFSTVTRPIKTLVKRKLNERGYYDVRSLAPESCSIGEFHKNAAAIAKRARAQTEADVASLRKRYEAPILGEISVERLLELLATVIDPTNCYLYCGSQLTHILQMLESMEDEGVTDRDLFAVAFVHDLGKLASLKGEAWENIESGGKFALRDHEPGLGLENGLFCWDHSDIAYARFKPYLPEHVAWLVRWHSIKKECWPIMDARDRALFEKYFVPFRQFDRQYIFYRVPRYRIERYVPLIKEYFPEKVLF